MAEIWKNGARLSPNLGLLFVFFTRTRRSTVRFQLSIAGFNFQSLSISDQVEYYTAISILIQYIYKLFRAIINKKIYILIRYIKNITTTCLNIKIFIILIKIKI